MSIRTIGRSRSLAWGIVAAFGLLIFPVAPAAAAEAESGALSGFIFAKDMKTPVGGAVIKIRNLADQKELASQPTDENGMFTIPAIPEGRYLLGVTSGAENFNLEYSVYVKAGELGKLSVALAPGAAGQEPETPPAKKPGFFNTVAGRALLVTAVGVAVYFIFFNESSPVRR